MRKFMQYMAIVACVAATIAPAHADTWSRASAFAFVDLIDLDPNDGISPWVQTLSVGPAKVDGYVQSTLDNYAYAYDRFHATGVAGAPPWGQDVLTGTTIGMDVPSTYITARGSVSWDPDVPGHQGMIVEGAIIGSSPALTGEYSASTTLADSGASFVLSPNTRLSFTFNVYLSASTEWSVPASSDPGFRASSMFELAGAAGADADSGKWELSASYTLDEQGRYIGQSEGRWEVFVFDLDNLTDDNVTGWINGRLSTYGIQPPLPVPEPSGAALLLGGLAAVGIAIRRRRRA